MKALDDAVQMAERVVELTNLRDDLGARIAELAEVARARLGMEKEGPARREAASGYVAEGDRAMEVEVGPLNDFAQLTGFEDAAAGIVAHRRSASGGFTGRATVSMKLRDPVELLRELEERAPFDFVVRDKRGDGLVLDVDEDGRGAGPRGVAARHSRAIRHTSPDIARRLRSAWLSEYRQVLTTNDKGNIAEAAIALEAIKLGINVFKPVAEHGRYDLAFDLGHRILRVQCKWARLDRVWGPSHPGRATGIRRADT